jgi:hypothetical protein
MLIKFSHSINTRVHFHPPAPQNAKLSSDCTWRTWCSILLYVIKEYLGMVWGNEVGTKAIFFCFYGKFISFSFIFHLFSPSEKLWLLFYIYSYTPNTKCCYAIRKSSISEQKENIHIVVSYVNYKKV